MPIEKKTPMRMCIACRQMKPKKEMLRIVKSAEGDISIDYKGKAAGRGAYICNQAECVTKLCKHKMLNKAFSCEIPSDIYEKVREEYLANKQ